MRPIKIVVDSTADINKDMYEEIDAEVLPLGVNFGEDSYLDNVTIKPDEIYERVKREGAIPKTAAVPPATYAATFRKYVDQGMDVICISIGSGFSRCAENALEAAKDFPKDRVYVLDTRNLSSASGFLACKIDELRKKGWDAKSIFAELERLKPLINTQFAVEQLDYLHKGGRCSGATKLLGHIFHIHPIVKVVDNRMIVYKKPRGKMTVALDALTGDIASDWPNVDHLVVFITHSGSTPEIIDYLHKRLNTIIDPSIIKVTRAGSVVSTHCGPGTIGILYVKKA